MPNLRGKRSTRTRTRTCSQAAPPAPVPEPEAEPEPVAASAPDDDLPTPAVDEKLVPVENVPEAPVQGENEQKSAEELLSEFEKMLG